jgi:hypothetical protein
VEPLVPELDPEFEGAVGAGFGFEFVLDLSPELFPLLAVFALRGAW